MGGFKVQIVEGSDCNEGMVVMRLQLMRRVNTMGLPREMVTMRLQTRRVLVMNLRMGIR